MSNANVDNTREKEEDAKHLTIDQKIDKRLEAYEANNLLSAREADRQREEMQRLMDADARLKKALDAVKLPNKWSYSPAGLLSKDIISKHLNSQKTGLHAMYPIMCNGAGCPYSSQCFAYKNNIQPPLGEPCVMEATKIDSLLVEYDKDFHFETCSATDMLQIQELVHLDIMMDRCNMLISQELTPVIEVNIGTTREGDPISQPAVSKYYEAYEKMSKRREAISEQLMATRKAKKNDKPDNTKTEVDFLRHTMADATFFDIEQRPEGLK